MNKLFYLSGLQGIIAVILILFLLPMVFMYIILPLLVIGLLIALIRKLSNLLPRKTKTQRNIYRRQSWGRGFEDSGPIIDVKAEKD